MEPDAGQPKAPISKPGSTSNAEDDLKSLPLPEVEKKLGSSPDGLNICHPHRYQAGGAARLKAPKEGSPRWVSNEC